MTARTRHGGLRAAMSPGATVVDRGQLLDCVYVVGSSGVQTQVIGSDGRQLTVRYGEQGRTFGLLGLVDQKGAPHEILAIAPTCIVTIPFQAIRETLASDPSLWFSVAQELAARFRRQIEMTEDKTFESTRVRLTRELLNLVQFHGESDTSGTAIRLRLSQARMGDLLGVSRQTVTTYLRELIQSRVLTWRYGRITVCDIEMLRRIAARGVV